MNNMHHLQLVESVSCFCLPALTGPGGWLLYHPFQALPRMARRLNLRSEHGTVRGFGSEFVWKFGQLIFCFIPESSSNLRECYTIKKTTIKQKDLADLKFDMFFLPNPRCDECVWIIYLHEVKNGHIQPDKCRQKFPYLEHLIFWRCDVMCV